MRHSDIIYSLEQAEKLLDEITDRLVEGNHEPLAYEARKFQKKIQRAIAAKYKEKANA